VRISRGIVATLRRTIISRIEVRKLYFCLTSPKFDYRPVACGERLNARVRLRFGLHRLVFGNFNASDVFEVVLVKLARAVQPVPVPNNETLAPFEVDIDQDTDDHDHNP
jgi:hypothetical protein